MRHPRDSRGFTLVELLIALTVFAIGLLALASMQITAIRANSSANRLTHEAAMAQGIMEQIRAWRPDDVRLASDATDQDWTFANGTTTYNEPHTADLTAVYTVATDTPVSDVSQVTVTVQSPEGQVTLTEYKKTVN